jgi:pimeloyl-ACP methyl ester carboxylesterase
LANFKKQLPAVDYAILSSSTQRLNAIRESAIESMQQSIKNVALDAIIYVYLWNFSAEEIKIPIQFFHGELDTRVPISMARKTVDRLPMTTLTTYPNEGHISILINQLETIARSLQG